MTGIPPEIAAFVELIGEHATLLLIEWHGGTRITIPADAAKGRLAGEIGEVAAGLLFDRYGHERVSVPLAKGWRARIYRGRGMSYAAIAKKLGCNEASVYKHLHLPTHFRQMDLPFAAPLPRKG
jgi:hypothetical protein